MTTEPLIVPTSLLTRRDIRGTTKLILAYYAAHPTALREEVAVAVGVTAPMVYEALRRGRELGLVEMDLRPKTVVTA